MYIKIGDLKLLKIQVIQNGVTVYEGMVEDAPESILCLNSIGEVTFDSGVMVLHV